MFKGRGHTLIMASLSNMIHASFRNSECVQRPISPFTLFFNSCCQTTSCPVLHLPVHSFLSNPPSNFHSLLHTHALIILSGLSCNFFFAAKLISLYASFHRPDMSTQVFDSVHHDCDSFLWNSIIKCHFSNGNFLQSLHLYNQMHRSGTLPNHFTMPIVASACAEMSHLLLGCSIHGVGIKCGLFCGDSSVGSGSSFIYFYSKCGRICDACKVFTNMEKRDVVSWTALIVGCVNNGHNKLGLSCLKDMHAEDGERPNSRTIEGGLKACGNLEALLECKCLHGFSMKTGIKCFQVVRSSLLAVYSKIGPLQDAALTFHELKEKDVVSWTAIIGSYARKGLVVECLEFFQAMLVSGLCPDGVLICCLLMAFAGSGHVQWGKAFHAVILRRNFEYSSIVLNSLMSMYCKLELLDSAENVFDMTRDHDTESWNLMLAAYGKKGLSFESLRLFREMQYLGLQVELDSESIVTVISSCSQLGQLNMGKSMHCVVIRTDYCQFASVFNSLMNLYGRCGKLYIARRIFDVTKRDIVTWNTMISVYARMGQHTEALALFDKMLLENMKPNLASFKIMVPLCASAAALHRGNQIYHYIKEEGLEQDIVLQTALVDMYAKCGQLKKSREIFDCMHKKDIISWNVMISGYGSHGYAKEALQVFREMEDMGVMPNELTFLGLLNACCHAGLVEDGRSLFAKMINLYLLVPNCKHYSCMVDLLGRSGDLKGAQSVIFKMPISPDDAVWGALLGACRLHSNIEMGEYAAKRALELNPHNDGYYIILANLYSCFGRWEDAVKVRKIMANKGMAKMIGWSA